MFLGRFLFNSIWSCTLSTLSPSVRENRWDGHYIGSVSGAEYRHLLWQEEDPQWYTLIFHWDFLQWQHVNMSFLCFFLPSRGVRVWWSLVRLYHGWCWVSYFPPPKKKIIWDKKQCIFQTMWSVFFILIISCNLTEEQITDLIITENKAKYIHYKRHWGQNK